MKRLRKHLIIIASSAVLALPGALQEALKFMHEGDVQQAVRRLITVALVTVMVNSSTEMAKPFVKKAISRLIKGRMH